MAQITAEKIVEDYLDYESKIYFGAKCIKSNDLFKRFNKYLCSDRAKWCTEQYKPLRTSHTRFNMWSLCGDMGLPDYFERTTPVGIDTATTRALKRTENKAFEPILVAYSTILKSYDFRENEYKKLRGAHDGNLKNVNGRKVSTYYFHS